MTNFIAGTSTAFTIVTVTIEETKGIYRKQIRMVLQS